MDNLVKKTMPALHLAAFFFTVVMAAAIFIDNSRQRSAAIDELKAQIEAQQEADE